MAEKLTLKKGKIEETFSFIREERTEQLITRIDKTFIKMYWYDENEETILNDTYFYPSKYAIEEINNVRKLDPNELAVKLLDDLIKKGKLISADEIRFLTKSKYEKIKKPKRRILQVKQVKPKRLQLKPIIVKHKLKVKND